MNRERLVTVILFIALLAGLLLSKTASAAVSDYSGCVPTPLPTTPTGPSVEKTWNLSSHFEPGTIKIVAWRVPCSDTDSAVLLRITTDNSGLIDIPVCGFNFLPVIQNSIQYESVDLVQEPGVLNGFCGTSLLVPQTFILSQDNLTGLNHFDDDAAFSLFYYPGYTDGSSLEIPAYVPTSATVNLGGTIKSATGTDICAMVLASGQFMFSCNPPGKLSLPNIPREPNGTVKRQIYADGFFPKIDSLAGSTNEAVVMTRSGTCPNYNASYDPSFVPGSAGKRINISGKVLTQNTQTPICAMVLANGKHTFSCNGTGSYALNIPLDNNGQFKLQVYADGFAPMTQTFDEFKTSNNVRMARASECTNISPLPPPPPL